MTKICVALPAAVALFSVLGFSAPSSAADRAPKHHRIAKVGPSIDAVQLSVLAPVSRQSTAEQTYGDAAIARSRVERYARQGAGSTSARYPCDPRVAVADGYVCKNAPYRLGYGQYYAFTPVYTTAPQIVGADPRAQTSLISPSTDVFLAANAFLFGFH